MKILHKTFLYASCFIIGFSIPVLLYFSNYYHVDVFKFFKKSPSNIEKSNETIENMPDLDPDSDIPLSVNANILNLLSKPFSTEFIKQECLKRIPDYGNKTRYEWSTLLTVSQFIKRNGEHIFLEIGVDSAVWENTSLDMKKFLIGNFFYCYPLQQKPEYLHIVDAETDAVIAVFNPKLKLQLAIIK